MKRSIPIAVAAAIVIASATTVTAAPDGKALYTSKCAMCHGPDGAPNKMGAGSKAFKDPEFKKTATVESIVKDVHDGKGKMKPIKTLTDAEAKAIAEEILAMPAAK